MSEEVKNEQLENVEELSDDVLENAEVVEEALDKTPEQLEIEKLQGENDALADKVLRAQAELQNVQKRQQKERSDLIRYRSQSLATALLPVIDSLEQALKVEVSDEQSVQLKKGLEMAYQNFLSNLESEGVTKIKALGEPFDPNVHQAIQQVSAQDGQASDTVVQVFQEGYMLHERVIRPAMVVIAQ
ncbi:nucleotide exchange factor GrpE [Carnobacteriaceae bacterium zg-ZUI252]|nr:nucleotide exchange factor GrpE [Carnobacteriaceae bacterium zg-ZUI252]MBS4770019.1 nucleotide exchange factor GrpE [Carnobacteriaceae bacterium zg-ZUI240]